MSFQLAIGSMGWSMLVLGAPASGPHRSMSLKIRSGTQPAGLCLEPAGKNHLCSKSPRTSPRHDQSRGDARRDVVQPGPKLRHTRLREQVHPGVKPSRGG